MSSAWREGYAFVKGDRGSEVEDGVVAGGGTDMSWKF